MCDRRLENHAEKVFTDESFMKKRGFLQLIEDSQKISAHVSSSIVYPKANLYYAFAEDVHPMKRIVTASKLFEKEKLLPPPVSRKEFVTSQDLHSKDEAVNHYLRTDPPSFVIFGKPGLDHANIASAIADAWNCVLLSPTSLIRQEIDAGTDKGQYLERILRLGRSIGPEILMNLIRCRVRTRDVKHRGYVIGCLPFISNDVSFNYPSCSTPVLNIDDTCPEFCENTTIESHETHKDRFTFDSLGCTMQFDYEREIPQQIDEIFTIWPRKPLIIIYLICPKQDVASKCTRQRVNYMTGDIFDENEFMLQPSESESDTSFDFFQITSKQLAVNDERLVKVISNTTRNVKAQCDLYERLALPVIDKWILAHNPQHVVRVDGRSSVRRILHILQTRLRTLALLPSILPKGMIEQNDALGRSFLGTSPEMNLSDELKELAKESAEEAFEILRLRKVVSLRFPWRLSAWKFYCPVELAQGRTVKGLPKHAVRFLDMIFFLSSQETTNLFIENPRTFLLPPNPRPTCKIAVFGPKYAGKSELSIRLAEVFDGTVINVDEIIKELVKQREKYSIREVHKNDSNVEQVSLPIDISVDEKADIIIQNIKRIPDEKLEEELRRDGGYVIDGMCIDFEVWRKIVDEANIIFEDIIVLFEEEPYAYLLNKFRTFSHLDDSVHDTEADHEEHDTEADHEEQIVLQGAEWEYLEHLTQFESEWTKFEEQIFEFKGNMIKCNLTNIEDIMEYVINHIKFRFDFTTRNVEKKNNENEILTETADENEANLANKDTEEKEDTIDLATAERLLDCGYYFLSFFGRWCPVQLYTNTIPIQMFLPMKARDQIFPVVYRPYIYFLAGEEALSAFVNNPSKYLMQDVHPPLLPLRISIIGPPKCGKTTLANRFSKTYGLKVITRGKALRYILKYYPWTESARIIEDQLRAGRVASIESVARAIEMLSIATRAVTQGYILDDCPSNRKETEQLVVLGIQPMIVLDFKADLEFCLECLSWDNDDSRSPLNFSPNFLSRRYEDWQTGQVSFRDWLKRFWQNVIELDATKSKWHVWTRVDHAVCSRFADIMLYFYEANLDKVHSLKQMCVSPYEFRSLQSRYESYCPVCLFCENILKTSDQFVTSQGMVQFREYFYWICPQHMNAFVEDPLHYLSPVTASLVDERPRILQETVDVEHACWAQRLQVGGLCLVTYVDCLPNHELTPGRVDLGAILKDKVYLFCSEECRKKFLAQHSKYSEMDITFPPELPIEEQRLSDVAFLEQTVMKILVKAVTLVGARRPKIFGLSAAVSAAVYIGVYLKMHNVIEDLTEMNIYKTVCERLDGQNRIIEIVTDTMKKINPYESVPK
ncbi:PREDICTED: adenylate kinase 9-like [Trachymyrmex septentrionalis]|uniref:adenylate kinase 9-like n=1 Tax=Trachymyrmex septentrionalis TaxID=34720 RepID=UPI00084F1F00|nr:PREDICTED: adenylate kinase 9-like [Trachymyrmex septentrionalis]